MIAIRRARPSDSVAIGAVHVAAWRSAYPGILPDRFLAGLSATRQAAYYDRAIQAGVGVYVATASGADLGLTDQPARIIGFATGAPTRKSGGPADGEIETLYVLDDWRERGLGRRLMRASAAHLMAAGCASAFVWVLRDNPNRWFYERLRGKPASSATIQVGGVAVVQVAYVWAPIDKLAQATSPAK